jgi:hypothetical protein
MRSRVFNIAFGTLFLLALLLPSAAFAAFDVSPIIIDGKGKPREILRYTVTLANPGKQMVIIYPWVSTLDIKKGDLSPADLEERGRSEILGNWIELARGAIAIPSGESREVPILVQVDLNAKPGNYHARLNWSPGSTRVDAEMNESGTKSVVMNIEVLDDANERLQLNTFIPDKNFFASDAASFTYKLENIGNRGIVPKGKIRIYDRKGEEVATIDANTEGKKLEPKAMTQFASVWTAGEGFGRYKALLDVEYGEGGHGTLNDTVFFWVIPWTRLLGMFASFAVLMVILAIVAHSYMMSGGKKFAFARIGSQRLSEEDEDEDEEDEYEDDIIPTPPPVSPPALSRVILAPSPVSALPTVIAEVKESKVSGTHQVTLAKFPAKQVRPEHIVNLKRS